MCTFAYVIKLRIQSVNVGRIKTFIFPVTQSLGWKAFIEKSVQNIIVQIQW